MLGPTEQFNQTFSKEPHKATLADAALNEKLAEQKEKPDVFRVMVIGESGLGKSTLTGCLFQVPGQQAKLEMYQTKTEEWGAAEELPGGDSTAEMRRYRYVWQTSESAPKTICEIIDTPGFATHINNSNSWLSKVEFIEKRINQFCNQTVVDEQEDPRVHLCMYVLPPHPRPLKELDKRVILELQRFVPVMPVIAKADCFDITTLEAFQRALRKEFFEVGIVPLTSCKKFRFEIGDIVFPHAPYAIIASNTAFKEVHGSAGQWQQCKVGEEGARLGRHYRWGFADCENHSDLGLLRSILIHQRPLIKEMCLARAQAWKEVKNNLIQVISEIHAELDFEKRTSAYDKQKSGCLGCLLSLEKPKKEDKSRYQAAAENTWKDMFEASFRSQEALETEVALHSSVSEGINKDELENFYMQRIEAQASYCPNPIRERLLAKIKEGIVRGVVTAFVSALLTVLHVPPPVTAPVASFVGSCATAGIPKTR